MSIVMARHRFALTQTLLSHIAGSYERTIKEQLKGVVQQHKRFFPHSGAYQVGGMCYCAEPYYVGGAGLKPANVNMQLLNPGLMGEHLSWQESFELFKNDWGRAKQILGSVIARVETPQDLRDILPEYVIQPVLQMEPILGLTRKVPDLYSGDPLALEHWNPNSVSMYQQVGSLIEIFVGYRFL